jgi:death on curing protein
MGRSLGETGTVSATRDEPWTVWIDIARVIELHHLALEKYGGPSGPADPTGCIDGVLGAAFNAELYIEGRRRAKTGLAFAAYALFYMVQRHCFVDGNKRVAWLTAVDTLASMGLGVQASEDEAFALMTDVIEHRIESADGVVLWFAPRLFALSDELHRDHRPEYGRRAIILDDDIKF